MKLRTKAILYISIVVIIFTIAMLSIALFVIQPGFESVENKENQQAITQTMNAINFVTNQLAANLLGYTQWDDTYSFVQTNDQSYIELNFDDSLFEQLNLNLVAIVDNNNNVLYCQSFCLNNDTKIQTSITTIHTLITDSTLWKFSSTNSTVAGIMLIDNTPMLVVTAPILTSMAEGPARGAILFGQFLDSQMILQLQQITDVNFSLATIGSFSSAHNQVFISLQSNPNSILTIVEGNNVSDYSLVNDVDSKPNFVLEISLVRTTYQQGVGVEYIYLAAAISLTASLGLVVGILIEKEVVKPISRLASKIQSMPLRTENCDAKGEFGVDEMSVLAASTQNTIGKKFEAMNEVSRMVAHDLRNPLAAIKYSVYLLKKNYGSVLEEKGNDQLKNIETCIEYSDKIVRDLLDFSCDLRLEKIPFSPKILVDEVLSTSSLPPNVQVANEIPVEFKVLIDNSHVKRVFGNLVKNASDAMPDGGVLNVTGEKVNGFVALRFSDSGVGMSEDTLKKLWTPFFTTKSKGMGVGLSICKKVIEAHDGKIEVSSILGKGTTFTVFLPDANS